MKIAKIKIPEEIAKTKNLKEIDLTKKQLGSTIALVGKNGAGKSRILKFVEEYVATVQPLDFFEDHFQGIPSSITKHFIQNIENAKNFAQRTRNVESHEANKQQLESQLTEILNPVYQTFRQLGQAYVKFVDNDDLKTIKENINNINSLSFEQILANEHFNALTTNTNLVNQHRERGLLNEFGSFNSQSTIKYLEKVTQEILMNELNLYIKNRDNPKLISEEIKKNKSFQLFDKFQGYVKHFLGKDFSYQQITEGNTVISQLYYNNEPFQLIHFSPGQKTLFAYAILFFYLDTNSKTNIRESIIIIDEPEKHLHPDAQIALIDALKSIVSKSGQLWIATHSIHILSHLEYDEIMMVKDDAIIPPSRTTPGKSFNDLMGIDDHILELTAFINSISEWAYGNFMLQCFNNPEVIFANDKNDPQFKLFKDFIKPRKEAAIQVLDFGAGKGRIGHTLADDPEVSAKILYSALEPNINNKELLKKVPGILTIYSSVSEIDDEVFDCVLLCNVLHEIDPNFWSETLLTIKRVLNSNGYLIIIEDKFLPKGENANQFGYLILGTDEVKELLNANECLNLKLSEPEHQDRIVFNAFRRDQINPGHKSVLNAIKMLNQNSLKNIKELRQIKNDVSHGRRYANETQLFINSLLAIEGMTGV